MKERSYSLFQRLGAFVLAAVMVFGLMPTTTFAADETLLRTAGSVTTVSDPDTVSRPADVYGDNTYNAGKVTVGKSVSDSSVTLSYGDTSQTFTPGDDQFIVTVSQTAQVMGLASESKIPLDVVFILDTSGSMNENGVNRAASMVTAANSAIATLMAANEHNRVAVVAFSSNGYGGGSSDGAAANVLSSLAHYTGDAATSHLQWVTDRGSTSGSNRRNIAGRDTATITIGEGRGQQTLTVNAFRRGYNGGTNIQAGIIAGAKLLTASSTTTTVTTEEGVVTRMPFLVILSDGQPTFSIDNSTWYDPTGTAEQGPGNSAYAGNGFLPALVAAYYKAKITEKYYGTNASEDNRCSIYTIGVQLTEDLAEMTLNPSEHFVSGSDNSYYSTFNTYWTNFSKETPANFNIKVNNNDNFQITAASINAARDAVNGFSSTGATMYQGGLAYNDDYFAATDTADIAKAFQDVVTSIQKKAISAPTHVDSTFGADFSGYVTFTDPIGEYMEVKQMYGILANGQWYQGKTFAQYLQNWSSAPQSFRDTFVKVLEQRCKLSGANVDVNALVTAAVNSPNQAYYNASGYDNSIVWWGNGFTAAGEEDEQVQMLGFADNDTLEYITDPNTQIPADADYVCRSYFYFGTAGDTSATPNEEFLYFMVRVQRSLTAPYQQTVVVSAPASLLSVEQVLITESEDESGNPVYTATVTEAEPARVVYEVGLRSDINAFNVAQILEEDAEYLNETAEFGGQEVYTNYNAATGQYTFYTNDWNRDASENSHERAGATATFDAAADNSFYTYQEDTLIYVKEGDSYVPYTGTGTPSGAGYYYAREVYDWSGATANEDGSYTATKRIEYIAVNIPAGAGTDVIKPVDGQWYIAKGLYKASSLTGGEDVYKSSNNTQTSVVVAHPHRTVSATNSHYTVYLGNNGKLTLQSEDTKTVAINGDDDDGILNADGHVVMVGDVLTYTIKVINGELTEADAVVTDFIPKGTEYVPGSASHDGVYDENTDTITWNISGIPSRDYEEVSFRVVVTEEALSGDNDVVTIDNAAYVSLSNGFEYETNTTKNPPEGKKVVDSEGNPITDGVQVPDVLVYRIRWQNDATDDYGNPIAAQVTVTDIIPEGTSYVENSASHDGVYNAADKTMTWTFEAAPGASGVVSFRVFVNADAGETIENGAAIQVENDPDVRVTNKTTVDVIHGNLIISKEVEASGFNAALDQEFTLNIVDIGGYMDGTYTLIRNGKTVEGGITFTNGVATVTIRHGDELEIQGIPVGTVISVTENAKNGFTPAYYVNGSEEANASEGRVTIVEGDSAVSVAVENTYAPAGVSFELEGTKILDTSVRLTDTVFGFTAYACDENGNVAEGASYLTGEVTVSSTTKEAAISFSPMTFTTTGTYYYLISEIDGGITGVTYAQDQYLLAVTVTDDGSGQLKASASLKHRSGATGSFKAADDISFTNTYAPLETKLTLEGSKVLTGRELKAEEFSFVVKDSEGNVVSTGYNDAEGNIIFRDITYTAAGTYIYTITEVNGGLHGVEYSAASYTVTVVVTDNEGQLEAKATYSDAVVFTNKYTPDGISVPLSAKKSLTGRDLAAGEFNFAVKDENGNVVTTGVNDAEGNIVFAPIGYKISDLGGESSKTFQYTVEEVIPDVSRDPYMSYDTTKFEVSVTVSYDSETGTLSYQVSIPEGGIHFKNTQYPDSIEVTPMAGKTTVDTNNSTENVPENATFSFTVVNVDTGNEAAAGVGSANGDVVFSTLSFSEAGTYRYWIKETHAGHTAHGITYDSTIYLMVVKVTLTDGKLATEVTYYSLKDGGDASNPADYTVELAKPAFKNVYDAKGQIAITAKKVLTGLTLKDGDFAFRLVREGTDVEITGVVDANGNVTFATLYFDLSEFADGQDTKTIHYVMSEVIPEAAKIPGVTYDATKHDVYITITNDGAGSIEAYVSDAEGNKLDDTDSGVTFTNHYAPQQGTSATIQATKTLTGRTLKDGEFSFQLYHVDGENEVLVDTTTNIGSAISFTRNYPANILNGAESRQIKYIVREVNNNLGGVKYDSAEFVVYVTITDNKDGTLSTTVTYEGLEEGQIPGFVNTYEAQDTKYTPVASKVLLNRDIVKDEFSFIITDKDGNVVSTGTNNTDADGDGKYDDITFSPIGYEAAGEYHYTVSEVAGNLAGVNYTDVKYYLVVTVVDNGDGTMTATGKYYTDAEHKNEVDGAVFTNVYTPANVSVQMQATKTLTGRDMAEGEFSFVVLDKDGKVVATGGNAAASAGNSAAVVFSNIGYDLEDAGQIFTYTIKELVTTQGGVTFDGTVYYAQVTVTNNATTGQLETSVKYYSDSACNDEISGVAFVNKYAPASVSLSLPVDKTLINKTLEAGEFTFLLKDLATGKSVSATNRADGTVVFADLVFTAPGTYYYEVSEVVTNNENRDRYTLDDPFTVVVTVVDNLKGQLEATAEYYVNYTEGGENTNLGGIEFINHYTAPELIVPLSTQIGATKTVNTPGGITYSPAGFRFAVTDITGTIVKGVDAEGNEVDMIGISDENGVITFPDFRFAQAGEYHYWIHELESNKEGIVEDGRIWEVHILVRYNEATGLLYVADTDVQTYLTGNNATQNTNPSFINTYTAEPTKLYLTASKALTGIRDLKDREFVLYLMEGSTIVAYGYNDVNGNVKFEMNYTEVGTHVYSVKEYIPENGAGGVTYDEKTYASVTVEIKDNGKGELVAYVNGQAVSDGATISTGVTVTNRYDAQPASAIILAHKAIVGDKVLKGGEFTFELVDGEGEVVATATNNGDGHVEFVIEGYTAPGTYTYTLREMKGNLDGVTYDESVYTVTVTVTDDGHGQLHTSVAYGTEDGHAPVFTNTYKAAATTAEIKAHKTLSGDKPLAAEKYTFELEDSEGNILTATNNTTGDVVFELSYDVVGEYTYILREKKGDELGTTYDDTEYTVTVKVVDGLNGHLVATVTYEGVEEGKIPGFVNSYKGAAATVLVNAVKTLEGKALAGNDYTFQLVNNDNAEEVYTAKNDAQGNVSFSLTFENTGVYTYTLSEKAGTDANTTYDETKYTVTVTVTDGLEGYMRAEVTYGTEDGTTPAFKNVYTPSAIEVVLTGTKALEGRDLKKDEFKFQVRDSEKTVVATGTNDASGKITFSGITLKEEGTYVFAVTEVNGGDKNIAYDTASFTVTVKVTNDNGVLKAEITYPTGGVKFENEYKDPDPSTPPTGDQFPMIMVVSLMLMSGSALVVLLLAQKKRNAARS